MEEIKKTIWKTTDNRFVAFIDILGFKDLVNKRTHTELYEQLNIISKTKKFLEDASVDQKTLQRYNDVGVYIVTFSDSIVLFSKNDSFHNFIYFLISVRWLFAKTIEGNIPLKGAIAYGEISLNKSEQIYFGQAIIDAYLMQEDVNYMGVVAHNSVDNYLNTIKKSVNLKETELDNLLFEDKTPLKCGSLIHYNLNWFKKAVVKESKDLKEKRIIELINNFKFNTSGSPRKYIDNTNEFFKRNFDNKNINL